MRRLTLLTAVACAALLLPAAGASARPRSQAAVAQRLARAVTRAHSVRKRTTAVRNVMGAVHIAVVTPKGKAIVVAPELRAARAFQLYDFELRGLADQLGRHETIGLGDLAALLAKAGLGTGANRALPAALLRDALVSASKKAAHKPRAKASLLPLLVRALGRRHGYDLAHGPATRKIRLDTLQAELITADIALPVLRRLQTGHGATTATAHAAGISDICRRYRDAEDKLEKEIQDRVDKSLGGSIQGWIAKQGAGKIFGAVVDEMKSTAFHEVIFKIPRWAAKGVVKGIRAADMANPIIAALHDILLSFSIDVSTPHESLPETHWDHHDGVTGKPLTFEVRVWMRDNYGDPAVKCGKLAGFTLPPQGAVKDVTVVWTQEQTPLAPALGTASCGTVCTSKTGDDGIARLVFTPYSEIIPGVGPQYEDTGIVTGTALYQSAADGGIAGQIAQFLTPKQAATRWFVGYHKQPNLALRITSTATERKDGDETIAGSFQVGSSGPLTRVATADTPNDYVWTTTGDQPLRYDRYSFSDTMTFHRTPPPDEVTTTTATGTRPGVLSGKLTLARDVPATRTDPGFTLALQIGNGGYPAGQPFEHYHRHDSVGGDSDFDQQRWLTDFGEAMQPYSTGTLGGMPHFEVGGWRRGAGSVVAYKDVSYSNTNGATTTVHVHLELDAEPAP